MRTRTALPVVTLLAFFSWTTLTALSAHAQTSPATKPARTPPRTGIDYPQSYGGSFQITLLRQPAAQLAPRLSKHFNARPPVRHSRIDKAMKSLERNDNNGFLDPAIVLVQLKDQAWTIWLFSNFLGDDMDRFATEMKADMLVYGYEDTAAVNYVYRYDKGKQVGRVEDMITLTVKGDPTGGDAALRADLERHAKEAKDADITNDAKMDQLLAASRKLFSRIFQSAGAYLPAFFSADTGGQPDPEPWKPRTPGGHADVAAVYVIRLNR